MINSRNLALQCARIADGKLGEGILVLDVREISTVTSYFVICSGRIDKHVRAIADEIEEKLKARHENSFHREGDRDCRWIVLDYVDVIVHVFDPQTRDYYRLENLWGDAETLDWEKRGDRSAHGEKEADEQADSGSD